MLKDADGAPVANHNFHDVETAVRGAANLLQPAVSRPPERLFLSIIDGIIPCPAHFGRPCLDLHEDEDLSLQYHQVEFIAAMAPILAQNRRSYRSVMLGRLRLAPTSQCLISGERAAGRPADPAT